MTVVQTQVQEKPILFSGSMVRAILTGRKTVTRRLLKLPRWSTQSWDDFEIDDDGTPMAIDKKTGCLAEIHCPHGKPGGRLWVREAHSWITLAGPTDPWYKRAQDEQRLTHDSDGQPVAVFYRATDGRNAVPTWRPLIFMPRWASRIDLDLTGVRVERLQDITKDEAIAEGLSSFVSNLGNARSNPTRLYEGGYISAVEAFENLWDSINAERAAWATNPYVWVESFNLRGK